MRPELEGKSICIWDAETDGFLGKMTKVHCVTITDAFTKIASRYTDIPKALEKLEEYDVHVGHNLIGFDYSMAKDMYQWEPKIGTLILDTLWMSRMYYPDIEEGHSLSAWGKRLKNEKKEYYPVMDKEQPVYNAEEKNPSKNPCWTGSIYTELMGDYCDQDCDTNVDLFWWLLKALEHFSWMSIMCEMETAKLIQRQMLHGFVFDYKAAEILYAKLDARQMELEDEVHNTFLPLPKFIKEIQPKVRLDGTVSPVGLKKHMELMGDNIFVTPEFTRREEDDGRKTVSYHSGSFSAIDWPEFSLGSRMQIAERLTLAGYKLTKFTEKGAPIINDDTLKEAADAGIAEAKPLAEYFLITKRVGMVRDWLSKAVWHEDQGVYRIHGYVNSLGAATNRMTHSSPNIAQVPSAHSPYGDECRSLFTVRPGYKLVGCDASGLELRCLANYMNDDTYTATVLHGDIHTANQLAAGLLTRDQAKTFN